MHVVCDNYSAHKHPEVKKWLAANPRVSLHFTPTGCSRLNLVEVFFSIITRQAIRRRHLHFGQGPHREDRRLHRRLERPLPAIRMD
jgi:transposase